MHFVESTYEPICLWQACSQRRSHQATAAGHYAKDSFVLSSHETSPAWKLPYHITWLKKLQVAVCPGEQPHVRTKNERKPSNVQCNCCARTMSTIGSPGITCQLKIISESWMELAETNLSGAAPAKALAQARFTTESIESAYRASYR